MAKNLQTTNHIFLVRPARFGPNPQTAESNAFQKAPDPKYEPDVRASALAEFDAMVGQLRAAGVDVIVFDDVPEPAKPDAIFPNNWISTHADGSVLLYPMQAENRRLERRDDIVEQLSTEHGFRISDIRDLSQLEQRGHFLEGTGSLVLDRSDRVAYAALSSRTDPEALAEFAQLANYEVAAFPTSDRQGQPIYHTNVMMMIGTRFAVVCADAIADSDKRHAVLRRISETGRQVIEISLAQMENFAGNMIELSAISGDTLIVGSRAAWGSLSKSQRDAIGSYGRTVQIPLETIESVGGGGVRCMIAEIFLPAGTDD